MSHTTDTDSLAAKITRAIERGDAGTFSELGRTARSARIDGMIEAWEHLTGEDGGDVPDLLAEAAKRHTDAEAAQAARDAAEGICASDIVRVGKGRTDWVVLHVDLYSSIIKSMTGHGAPTKRVDTDTLTLVAKGPRTSDFHRA